MTKCCLIIFWCTLALCLCLYKLILLHLSYPIACVWPLGGFTHPAHSTAQSDYFLSLFLWLFSVTSGETKKEKHKLHHLLFASVLWMKCFPHCAYMELHTRRSISKTVNILHKLAAAHTETFFPRQCYFSTNGECRELCHTPSHPHPAVRRGLRDREEQAGDGAAAAGPSLGFLLPTSSFNRGQSRHH